LSEQSLKIAALILAGGESKRLGTPKQNLIYKSTTLLNHIKEHLTLYFVDRTFIVLGAYANEIVKASNLTPSEIIEFKGWKEGMGSSLSYACSIIFSEKKFDGILITLGDLPLVDKTDYQKMIDLFESKNDIVATRANNSLGVPALFGSDYFDELVQIKGKKGAKPLIQKYSRKVKVYDNDRAAIDIDTVEDFSAFIQKK
jgi:molybdenum cofactor cytidylyltransferase